MKLLTALLSVSIVAPAVLAQPFPLDVLHNFTPGQGGPGAPLVQGPDGNFYGTTPGGGIAGLGRVFKVTPTGMVTTLVNFTGPPNGQNPWIVGLVLDSAGNFYGTTDQGGTGGQRGTVFKMTASGVLTTLVNFNNANGSFPRGLIMGSDGNLYGTTVTSASNAGTVFKLTTSGVFTTLATFPANYGYFPAGLVAGPDGNLYGRTYEGYSGNGTVFRVTMTGTLTTLANLSGCEHPYSTSLTLGNDGNFYGTTYMGGSYNCGTAFRVTTAGSVTTLVNFNRAIGIQPAGPLTLGADGNFYGTTVYGGIYEGTVFRMTPNGTVTTLANFPSREFGVRPYAGVTFGADGNLYGTTSTGGSGDSGIIFRVNMPEIDTDGDGVLDDQDECPNTAPGAIVDASGCSIEQLVPCDGPWKNHGQYVSAVTAVANDFLNADLIDKHQRNAIVRAAAQSDCGKKR